MVEVISPGTYTEDFNNEPIIIADIPNNLSACGSTTKTRFPIFTGC